MTKLCKWCGIEKELTLFTTDGKKDKGRDNRCKACKALRMQYYRKLDPEKFKKRSREQNKKLKGIVQKAYGNKCICCLESNPLFLTIDHINNDGNKQRLKLFGRNRGGAAHTLYLYIIKNNFPSDLQLLCYNCNMGKKNNNLVCPHKDITCL
jgi:hypothetical protein